MESKERQTSLDVLSKLNPVFDLRELQIATGVERKHASQMCWRWSRKGYVKAFSEGVYFNLVADRQADKRFVPQAIDKAAPGFKIVVGVNALNEGGWTTQMPRIIELAVPSDRTHRTHKQMEGVNVVRRNLAWFRKLVPVCHKGATGLLTLPPAYALVDCFMEKIALDGRTDREANTPAIWHPDPDDIAIDSDADQAFEAIQLAAEELGAPIDQLSSYLSEIDAFEEVLAGAAPAL